MGRRVEYTLSGADKRLYDAWKRTGLNQEAIANQIEVNRKSINYYLNGSVVPSATTLGKMCKIFGVSADYILFGE